jgi:serine/threonine protein kinase
MAPSLTTGTLLADTYRVVRHVGSGGMGEVYEATHARLPGRYAIKLLLAEISGREGVFQRFQREAEVTSGLRHPNIVQVLDFNKTPEGYPYLVMEYLEGIELEEEIRRVGAMPTTRALDIIGQIASALAAAHSHKIVHRDLKPQNLILVRLPGEDREVVKVLDFGISKVREATTKLTQESAVMGTPQYMAPEQAEGKLAQIDERTDQFSLAAIAYELLTGHTAFCGDSVPSILFQVVYQQPESIRRLTPTVGSVVEAVVFKALSKAKENRYPSVLDFHRELVRAVNADQKIHTAEISDPPAATPRVASPVRTTTTLRAAAASPEAKSIPPKTNRRWLIGAGAVVVVVSVGAALWGTRGRPTPATTTPVAQPPSPAPAILDPPPVAAAKTATVEVEDGPPGLQVTVDGVVKPLPVTLPKGTEMHTLLFQAEGFEPREIQVDGTREHRSLVLTMKPIPPPPEYAVPKRSPSRPASPAAQRPAKSKEKKAKLITDF